MENTANNNDTRNTGKIVEFTYDGENQPVGLVYANPILDGESFRNIPATGYKSGCININTNNSESKNPLLEIEIELGGKGMFVRTNLDEALKLQRDLADMIALMQKNKI